jgi:hypothetical protein
LEAAFDDEADKLILRDRYCPSFSALLPHFANKGETDLDVGVGFSNERTFFHEQLVAL